MRVPPLSRKNNKTAILVLANVEAKLMELETSSRQENRV
jgi:hypothetical protein